MPFNTPGPRASIDPHSDRAVVWFNIFGTLDDIPVTKYLPDVVDLPGRPACDVYRLDLQRITPAERTKLIDHLAARFGLARSDVEVNLDREGVPILADDVTVAIPLRLLI